MISIKYTGRMGNNLFQYTAGRILHERTEIQMGIFPSNDTFENRAFFPKAVDMPGETRPTQTLFHDETNADDILSRAYELCEISGLDMVGFFQNWKYYVTWRSEIRRWLQVKEPRPVTNLLKSLKLTADDWIMHVRHEDYIESGSILSSAYYEKALLNRGSGRLYLIGKDLHSQFVDRFVQKHGAIRLSGSGIEDFAVMRNFNNIICSNSTFAWWAAFLSEAGQVFVPRPTKGYWSDLQNQRLQSPELHTILDDNNG